MYFLGHSQEFENHRCQLSSGVLGGKVPKCNTERQRGTFLGICCIDFQTADCFSLTCSYLATFVMVSNPIYKLIGSECGLTNLRPNLKKSNIVLTLD